MAIRITDSERIEILFNKSFGASTPYPGASIATMPLVNAGNKVLPALQVFSQYVPPVAPREDELVVDSNFNTRNNFPTIPPDAPACVRKYSSAYPWIVKYENLPLQLLGPKSFKADYKNDDTGSVKNLLSESIPFNYDPAGNYGVSLLGYVEEWGELAADSEYIPWYYESAAGFVTFYGPNAGTVFSRDTPPLMTFWRYEGKFGLSSDAAAGTTGSSGIGATGPAGIGATGPAGPAGIGATGPAGPAGIGATGPAGPAGIGATGPAGIGATGPAGIGPTGPAGIGPTGPAGIGATGPAGIGATGPAGIGATGPAGIGATGPAGIGATGPAGIGATGPAGIAGATGAMGPTGPGSGAGAAGTYANDTWLLTYLLGQPPAVVFGDPVRTSDTIYIPWTFPTQRKVPWGTNIKLPIIDTCTISLIVEGQPEYIIQNNVTTSQLISGQTTVLAIAKPPAATGFSSNGTYNSFYMYSGAGVDQITNSSVNKLKVVFSNTSEFSPTSNPSIIQFSGFSATGASGTSGTTGTSGASGTTGPSGSSGTSGPSGTSGTTGPSGTSGTSGASGTSGTTGPSGTSGTSGTTGPSGTSGTSGTTGPSGTSGTTGPSGTSGTSGTTGPSGTSGTSGASGRSGTTGPSGSSGTSGTTGPSGTSGTSGTTGPSGTSGTSGTTGPSGTSGTTGPSGSSGTSGATGPSGTSGTSGTTGPSGSSGTSGATGPSGTSGTSGTTGPSGTSGTSGATGPSGTSGTSGTTGPSGTSGTSGITGPSGTSGTSGTTGPSGTSGTSGASGTSGGTAPAEPPALTSILLKSSQYAPNSSTIYRVFGPTGIGSVPLINAAQVDTEEFTAPVHRLANRGASGPSTLMTLSAKLNSTNGPSVNYSGFPATKPAASSSIGGMIITPNLVADGFTGSQAGYYLTSKDTITVVPSAGSDVNTLTATQTFSNPTGATGASASASFYYDTYISSSPTCSINALTIPRKVSGLSIIHDTTANITINATANNMGKYFYRSPLIKYNYSYGGNVGTLSESTLANVRTSDISGNMFTNGNLNFSSPITLTGINNTMYSTTSIITIDASANNIIGSGGTSNSFKILIDPSSSTLVYTDHPTGIPELTPTATPGALTVTAGATCTYGARIWSAPITTNPSATQPASQTLLCPDFSYNGIFYTTMPYDNAGSLTSTDPSGCQRELLISNGLFTTPTKNPSAYIDYSPFAGNAGLDYSTIGTTGYRFATFCWKLPSAPTAGTYSNLSFYINSVNAITRNAVTGIYSSNATPMQVFYAFQNVADPRFVVDNWNSIWIRANTSADNKVSISNYYDYSIIANRYGASLASSPSSPADRDTLIAKGTVPFYKVFFPASPIPANGVYVYLRIGVPMNKDMRFGGVFATLTKPT